MRVKNIDYPISQVASNAQQALQEFQQADCVVSTSVAAHSQPWNSGLPPPPQNSLKVNFDRAIFKNINKVGIGVVRSCALPIHPTTNWWRMRGHTFFIAFDRRPSPLVLERIVKSLTIPPSQCDSNDLNLWPGSDTICRTVCFTDPSNDQLVKDEGAHIFYSICSQTKSIDIGAYCEIPYRCGDSRQSRSGHSFFTKANPSTL